MSQPLTINIPAIKVCNYEGVSFSFKLYHAPEDSVTSTVVGSWFTCTIATTDSTGTTYDVVVSALNPTAKNGRYGTISFSYTSTSPSYGEPPLVFEIYQVAYVHTIWSDFKVLLEDVTTTYLGVNVPYSITLLPDKTVIYEGTSVARDSKSYPTPIYLNRIVESYVNPLSFIYNREYYSWDFFDDDIITVAVRRTLDNSFVGVYSFVYDYSYDYIYSNNNGSFNATVYDAFFVRNNLISNTISPMMLPSLSVVEPEQIHSGNYKYISYKDSTILETILLTYIPGITNEMNLNPTQSVGQNRLVVTRNDQPIMDLDLTGCGQGAIYYLNRQGAWDYLLIEGNISETKSFDRTTYSTDYDNNVDYTFSKMMIKTEIVTDWELTTGWLNDRQSDILVNNLLCTPKAYLQLFDRDDMIPVLITNSESKIKKFRNGRKLNQYTITCENSKTQSIR